MKKILFPTDFSPAAEKAFIYALKVANALGATITTLHVYERPDLRALTLPPMLQRIYNEIQLEEFENYRDQVPYLRRIAEEQGLTNISVQHLLVEGETVPAIINTAKEERANLIIMGTQGATGFREVFLGTVAAEVIEKVQTCPVLAVPATANFDGTIDKIAVTTNYEKAELEAIRYTLKFAEWFDAQVYCLHVDVGNTEMFTDNMNEFTDIFRNEPRLQQKVLAGFDIEKTLTNWLKENEVDLIAMLNHRRNKWRRFVENNYTKMLVNHQSTPVLALPIPVLEHRILTETGA